MRKSQKGKRKYVGKGERVSRYREQEGRERRECKGNRV